MTAKRKWFSSGRGIFTDDAGFQMARTPASVCWEEDTKLFVDLLNKGEAHDDLAAENARLWGEVKEQHRRIVEAKEALGLMAGNVGRDLGEEAKHQLFMLREQVRVLRSALEAIYDAADPYDGMDHWTECEGRDPDDEDNDSDVACNCSRGMVADVLKTARATLDATKEET